MDARLITLLIGAAAGLLSGLLGVGGGIIMVPATVFFLRFTQHRAHGTSLAVILFVACAGVVTYVRDGQIRWETAAALAVGGIVGANLGARLAKRLPAMTLRRYFGAFMVLVAARMLYDAGMLWQRGDAGTAGAAVPHLAGLGLYALILVIGLATGVLSGLMGVGGGVIMVPTMVLLLGFPQTLAQGISLAVIIPTALSGAIMHYRLGNIRPSDVCWLALGGLPAGWLGSILAIHAGAPLLRVLFGLLLAVVGVMMVRPATKAAVAVAAETAEET